MNIVTFKFCLHLKLVGSIRCLWSSIYTEKNRVGLKLGLHTRERACSEEKGFSLYSCSISQISRDALLTSGLVACSVEIKCISNHRWDAWVSQGELMVEIAFLWPCTSRAEVIPDVTWLTLLMLCERSNSLTSFVLLLKARMQGQPLQKSKPPYFHLYLYRYNSLEPAP